MAQGYLLSEQDRHEIQGLLAAHRARVGTATNRGGDQGIDHQEHQAPEVYIGKTRDRLNPGAPFGSFAGWQDVDVFKIAKVKTGAAWSPPAFAIAPLEPMRRRALSLYMGAIPVNTWVLLVRDKFGAWLLIDLGGGLTEDKRYITDVY